MKGMNSIDVLGTSIAYRESGSGRAVVFLHGNPTSSYLWRNVIPHIEGGARCLAPDLVGMGDSGPSLTQGPERYTFADHARHLDAWFDALGLNGVVLVGHDWGGALGFDWASRNPDRVAGIAYMETIVCPVTWTDWPEAARAIFQAMRSPAGEEIVLEKNVFVERILPASILRKLEPEEMEAYQRPFAEPGERRRPTLTWPRQIPVEGEPREVAMRVEAYGRWLEASSVPKLFINAEPGSILVGRLREYARSWPNQRELTVRGSHFIQEDSPVEIGTAIAGFLAALG
jgi:haloalkane dehalogenase